MNIIKSTRIRPNVGVEYSQQQPDKIIREAEYMAAGKLIDKQVLHLDELTKVIEFTFVDQAALDEWESDPVIQDSLQVSDAYCIANGIVATREYL